jgi:hypothetical protein
MANPFDLLKDYPGELAQLPTMRPEQIGVQNQILGSASNLLNQKPNQYNPAASQKLAIENFKTNIVPGLAERFLGRSGVAGSSAFTGQLGAAGSNLQAQLEALGEEYGFKNRQLNEEALRNRLAYGLSPSFENVYTKPQPGPGRQFGEQLIEKGANKLADLGVEKIAAVLGLGTAATGAAAVAANQAAQTAAAASPQVASSLGFLGKFGITAAMIPAIAQLGVDAAALLTTYKLRKHLEEQGMAQEAAEAKQQEEKLAKYLEQKSQGQTVRDANLPQRQPNEDVGSWLNRAFEYNRTSTWGQDNNNPTGGQ